MFKLINKKQLATDITLLDIEAPLIAAKARPGQFVVVIADEKSERIPLTITDWDSTKGRITLIVQKMGFSTQMIVSFVKGDSFLGVLGPLGHPSPIKKVGTFIAIGGGVGIAEIFPIARGYKQASNKVISIIGSRSKDLLILEEELKKFSDQLLITTDDGSKGAKGFVTSVLKKFLEDNPELSGENTLVYAVGPLIMMQAVSEVTKARKIKTLVSLNPIMVDATGMCGACRVTVGGKICFACVDGPEFDAHQVDFNGLLKRLGQHKQAEHECKIRTQLTERQ
jgi:ferredoxin--NADP+ reductase